MLSRPLHNDNIKMTVALYKADEAAPMLMPSKVLPLWVAEKQTIERAIEMFSGNIAKAANALEVSPSTIYRKIQSWNAKTE